MKMRMFSIGDIADVLPGYAFKSSVYSTDGVKLLRGVNVNPDLIDWSDCAFWKRTDSDGLDNYVLRNGDIVIGMDRPWISSGFRIAVINDSDLPSLLVQRIARLRIRKEHHQKYLYYILRGSEFQSHLKNRHTETTVPHISHKDIESFKIEMPSLPEQRRIADILDKADAIRRKRKQAIALTDQLLRSTFLEMFGDPVTNPKGFPDAILADVVTFRSGDFLPAREMDKDGIYPVYGGNGITGFHGSYMFPDLSPHILRLSLLESQWGCSNYHLSPPFPTTNRLSDTAFTLREMSHEPDSFHALSSTPLGFPSGLLPS